MSKNC